MSNLRAMMPGLSCTLIPGNLPHGEAVSPIYNAAYEYWNKTWSEFFEKAGSPPGSLSAENFLRHAVTVVLHQNQHIVGTLSSSFYNLAAHSTYDHPCIMPFREYIAAELGSERAGLCMTAEYLSVHRDFRKAVTGISMGDVLVGLLEKVFVGLQGRLLLATTVKPAKVDAICASYGYKAVGNYVKCGVDCVMMYNTQDTHQWHPLEEVVELTDRLWKASSDLTGFAKNSQQPNRRRTA